jgi:hypothetical protein
MVIAVRSAGLPLFVRIPNLQAMTIEPVLDLGVASCSCSTLTQPTTRAASLSERASWKQARLP